MMATPKNGIYPATLTNTAGSFFPLISTKADYFCTLLPV